MNVPPSIAFRLATLLFAILLSLQCAWLSLTGLLRTGIDRLPTDPRAAAAAAGKRDAAARVASIGAFRGELWAQSAFTYAELLFTEAGGGTNKNLKSASARARLNLDRALGDAPHQSGAWLLLAGLAARYPSPGLEAKQALKMSYYTGPSEPDLMLLRLRIAAHSDAFSDIEIRQFVSRDLRVLLAQKQKSAIAEVYDVASPAGQRFIEQVVKDFDSSAVDFLRAGPHKDVLPD